MNMSYRTMCELKMAWYWPRFFFCVLRLRCSQNLLSHKKRTRPVSSHLGLTEHAFLILHKEHHFSCGTQGNLEWARQLHLGRSDSQSQHYDLVHLTHTQSQLCNNYCCGELWKCMLHCYHGYDINPKSRSRKCAK